MGDVFKAITSGVARHIFAWALPSALTVGVLLTLVSPSLRTDSLPNRLIERSSSSWLTAAAAIAFIVVMLAVISGYLAQPAYRLLEGYHLPRQVDAAWRRRQLRVWWRVHGRQYASGDPIKAGLMSEKRLRYPERRSEVMATRLGNALKAAETYGRNRWNLDFQTLWYEAIGAAPETLIRALEDARAGMDFFASMIVHFSLLGTLCLALSFGATDAVPVVVGVAALSLTRPAYSALVRQVDEYRSVMQAVVNTSRKPLAANMAYELPFTIDHERYFWGRFTDFVLDGRREDAFEIDTYRASPASVSDVGNG